MFKSLLVNGVKTRLYYHQTNGGAEYLSDTYIKCSDGSREGCIKDSTKVLIRVDGGEIEIMRMG